MSDKTIQSLTEKATLVAGDYFVVADSEDDYAWKKSWPSSFMWPFVTVWPAWYYANYVCDWVADNVQINAAIDYLYDLWWWTLLAKDWIYDIQWTIYIKANVKVMCGHATVFRRNASFIWWWVKNIVELSWTDAQMRYWTVDWNSVAEPVGWDHSYNISLSWSWCILDSVRSIGAGDGIDSCIGIIWTSGSPIAHAIVRNCIAERNTNWHFYQTTYADFKIVNCQAIWWWSSTVQDGFRTYENSKWVISWCYAKQTRVWFQSRPTGTRDVHFVDCHADTCFQHWFLAQATWTLVSGCSARDCLGRAIYMDWWHCTLEWFIANRNVCWSSYCVTENTIWLTTANGGDVYIAGNYNNISWVRWEGYSSSATWYCCIVEWAQNVVQSCAVYNSWFRRVYLYWASNKVLIPVTQTVTDVWASNSVI